MLGYMPTTEKVIWQIQFQACDKSMSANNLNYSHAADCVKRVQEVHKPKAITMPEKSIPKLKKTLPIQCVEQDVESDDEEVETVEGSSTPSDDIESNAMTKLTTQTIKAQEEYMTNKQQPDLPMYTATEIQKCKDIILPTYEVIMKQEKYDKLVSNAF